MPHGVQRDSYALFLLAAYDGEGIWKMSGYRKAQTGSGKPSDDLANLRSSPKPLH